MKFTDHFIGKDIKSLLSFIAKDIIYCINEIHSPSEINKQIDELKSHLNKASSNKYLIITLKRK